MIRWPATASWSDSFFFASLVAFNSTISNYWMMIWLLSQCKHKHSSNFLQKVKRGYAKVGRIQLLTENFHRIFASATTCSVTVSSQNIRSLVYLSMFLMSILQPNIVTRISVSLPTLLSAYNYWRLIRLFPQSQQKHSTNFVHTLTRSYVKVGRIQLLSRISHLIGNFFHGHNLKMLSVSCMSRF
jgi:hypothetical protein